MKNVDFDHSVSFNLKDLLQYSSNQIGKATIVQDSNCTVEAFTFDFGKVKSFEKSHFLRLIHIIEGKAEVVLHNNSTFLQQGDSILIPPDTHCSLEANQKFKMICTAIRLRTNLSKRR